MNREQELSLIERCLAHAAEGSTTSALQSSQQAARYLCPERFSLEMDDVFMRLPSPVLHASSLAEACTFQLVDTPLGKLLATRDEEGRAHLFYNSCRHRGGSLVSESRGSSRRLNCPYHAWSYATDGSLQHVPEEESCFPGLDKSKFGLIEISSVERYGFIWACPGAEDPEQTLADYLGDMAANLEWLQTDKLFRFDATRRSWRANWKIVAEGALETYHFVFAHRETIGPHFQRNLAVIDQMGSHFRVVMPTRAMDTIVGLPASQQHLRDFTHTLFSLMPSDSLLVQKAHIDWIKFRPIAVDETEITITSLVPENPGQLSEERANHWRRNLEITDEVLAEDFELGEGIQRSVSAGAIDQVHFGCNEWALKAFNDALDSHIKVTT